MIAGCGTFRLRQYDASTRAYATLLGPTSSSAIRTGNQTNRLKVVRRGGTITLFANGQQIGQTADTTFGRGFVGFIASGFAPGFEARFDNFLLVFDADDTMTQAIGVATSPADSFVLAVPRLEEVPIVGADAP